MFYEWSSLFWPLGSTEVLVQTKTAIYGVGVKKPIRMMLVTSIAAVLLASAIQTLAETAFSLEAWMSKDPEFKLGLVQQWIAVAKDDGVTIRLPAAYYVVEIDSLISNSIANDDVEGLKESLGVSLKTIAIMDCDWDDGTNRLQAAAAYLGEENLVAIREIYPDKYALLENDCESEESANSPSI